MKPQPTPTRYFESQFLDFLEISCGDDPERGNRNIFGHTQEPHLKNFLLRQPQVKMSMQIAVKFVELIHASNRINHLNYPMAFPVLSASQ